MGDLFDWALSIAQGESRWRNSAPLAWADEKARFFEAPSEAGADRLGLKWNDFIR